MVRERGPEHGGVHGTKRQAVAAYAERREFNGGALREAGQGSLAGAVGGQSREFHAVLKASHASDADHMSRGIASEVSFQRLGKQQGQRHIQRQQVHEGATVVSAFPGLDQRSRVVHKTDESLVTHTGRNPFGRILGEQVQFKYMKAPWMGLELLFQSALAVACNGYYIE
jgi:hypothetical protein